VNLIYVLDPMCSWCYGFGKPLQTFLDTVPDTELTLIVGGLRPFTTEALSDAKRNEILTHWHHVGEASGQTFAQAPLTAMHASGFIYDTEPACRAIVTVREHWPAHAWHYTKAIQRAFYAEAKNITHADVLADIAADAGLDREAFIIALESDAMKDATRSDFAQAQAWGIRGFPALIAAHKDALHMVSNGYCDAASLAERTRAVLTAT
jgi:putative protein-disulfide isomerase